MWGDRVLVRRVEPFKFESGEWSARQAINSGRSVAR
jgi:hypothetical protein